MNKRIKKKKKTQETKLLRKICTNDINEEER
jgi:hypothetical protein